MNKEKIGIFCPICKGEKLITSNLGEVYCVDCKKNVMNFNKMSTLIALNTNYDILKENQNQKAIECLKDILNHFTNRPTWFDVARLEYKISEQDKKFIEYVENKIKELEGE